MTTPSPSPRSRHPRADTCAGRPVAGVLAMLAAGKTQREVAMTYGVDRATIQYHADRHGLAGRTDRHKLAAKARTARVVPLKDAAKAAGVNNRPGRTAFALKYRRQYTASEIAEALGVSRGVIVGIWYRARQRP
jgi:DNA-directed RNA polymerase specialized sigma24 family protein